MVRRSVPLLMLVALTAAFIYAQDKQPDKKPAQITGFLVDNTCVKGTDKEDRLHTTECALMPESQKAGYSIVSKDTVFKLDENGNKLAIEVLKSTKKKKALAVTARGTLIDNVLAVDEMVEVK